MSKFKAIGFDWSGVVFCHTMNYREDGSRFLNISKEEFSAAYFKHNHLSNVKNISSKDFWRTVFLELGRESEVDDFIQLIENAPLGKMNQEILSLITILKDKGYKVGLLSNNTTRGAIEARSLGVEQLFDVDLFSVEVGLMKPDPEAFIYLADKLWVDITEMVFIDDAPKSLERAGEAGYQPILYTDMKALFEELRRLNILTEDDIKSIC